ncbi:hypothetical protein NQ317_005120 [Molorchus minor]|uniref:Uncharacterized protein n=1 Tax=Molorchus minor TaxID=1323400 RepID=A0ABQ9IT80_9CUCU|nr:hypothetical protein NQ317_005120 [Molorchus minor]
MLSKAIYDQVFIEGYKDTIKAEVVEQCNKELLKHDMRSSQNDFQKDNDCWVRYAPDSEPSSSALFFRGSIGLDVEEVMKYCSGDVIATYEALKQLFPMFLERFLIRYAGIEHCLSACDSNWPRYITECEQAYEDLESEGKNFVSGGWQTRLVKKSVIDKKKKSDLKEKEDCIKKKNEYDDEKPDPLENRFKYLWDTKASLPSIRTLLPGYPNWYRKLSVPTKIVPVVGSRSYFNKHFDESNTKAAFTNLGRLPSASY